MKKIIVFFLCACLWPLCADAKEQVTINEGAFAPEPKKPRLNIDETLNSAAKEAERTPARPARRPRQPFTPQGQDHTEDIVQAQKENKRRIGLGEKAETAPQAVTASPEEQYRRLGNLYYTKMLIQAENEIMALKRKQVLDQKKFEEEISLKSDNADFERLMGMGLPAGAQPLPVISQQPQAAPTLEAPVRRPSSPNEEPALRVVGIQGYKGKFTAQVMNNGGISNVSPGMQLEHGIQVLSISEDGVKVRRTKQLESGESQTEVITLPLSR